MNHEKMVAGGEERFEKGGQQMEEEGAELDTVEEKSCAYRPAEYHNSLLMSVW